MNYEILMSNTEMQGNIPQFGIRCVEQGKIVMEIADISDRKEFVEALTVLFNIGKLHPCNLMEALESILGVTV